VNFFYQKGKGHKLECPNTNLNTWHIRCIGRWNGIELIKSHCIKCSFSFRTHFSNGFFPCFPCLQEKKKVKKAESDIICAVHQDHKSPKVPLYWLSLLPEPFPWQIPKERNRVINLTCYFKDTKKMNNESTNIFTYLEGIFLVFCQLFPLNKFISKLLQDIKQAKCKRPLTIISIFLWLPLTLTISSRRTCKRRNIETHQDSDK